MKVILNLKRQKNDAADAEAICEAVTRPTMRFVPVKTPEQQSVILSLNSAAIYVGAAIVLVLLVGGWLLTSNWSKMFPNGTEPTAADTREGRFHSPSSGT